MLGNIAVKNNSVSFSQCLLLSLPILNFRNLQTTSKYQNTHINNGLLICNWLNAKYTVCSTNRYYFTHSEVTWRMSQRARLARVKLTRDRWRGLTGIATETWQAGTRRDKPSPSLSTTTGLLRPPLTTRRGITGNNGDVVRVNTCAWYSCPKYECYEILTSLTLLCKSACT